jgi:hypothetical protein
MDGRCGYKSYFHQLLLSQRSGIEWHVAQEQGPSRGRRVVPAARQPIDKTRTKDVQGSPAIRRHRR